MPKVEVPSELRCPITKKIFNDPVLAEDGIIYDRTAIQDWLEIQKKTSSPVTKKGLPSKTLRSTPLINEMVNVWLAENKICPMKEFHTAVVKGDVKKLLDINYLESYLESYSDFSYNSCASEPFPLLIISVVSNLANLNLTEVITWLLDEGVNIETPHSNGSTALSFAAQEGNKEAIDILVKRGAIIDVNTTDNKYTPLMWAITNNKINSVKVLIAHHANLDAKDIDGNTPLHLAVLGNNKEMIKLLVEQGADYKAMDNANQTPVEVAIAKEYNDLAVLIQNCGKRLKREQKKVPARLINLEIIVKQQQVLIEKQQQQIVELFSKIKELSQE